jgi:hypothetical protein
MGVKEFIIVYVNFCPATYKSVAPANNDSFIFMSLRIFFGVLFPVEVAVIVSAPSNRSAKSSSLSPSVLVMLSTAPTGVGPLTTLPRSSVQSIMGELLLPSATWSRGNQRLKTSQMCKREGDFTLINAVANCFLASVTRL